jgi:isoquinoline 1-oxidoreductase subunit alpha
MAISITVNGKRRSTEAASDTPLLYVLRNELELRGPKFGCGLSQCGACSVLVDGKEIRSCVTPVAAVEGRKVTTLEGLPAWFAQEKQLATVPELHPLQQAWIDEQVPQCGYCQSGMIVMAADLLARNARPSDSEIKQAMDPHLCRCATHNAIVRAIKRAASATAEL